MTRPYAILFAMFVTTVVGSPLPARADDSPKASIHEAADHFERGVKLYEEQDWRSALIEFERAYSISPHYSVLYNIGQCRYQLQDYAGSLTAFETYLATGGGEESAEQQQRVKATLDALRGRVAQVVVVADVDGAEITVDDVVVGTTPLASPVVVSEGRRKIVASKVGRKAVSRYVDVAGRDSADVSFHLEPAESAAAPIVVARASQKGHSMAPAVVLFGFAAAAIGVGTVYGSLAISNRNELDVACPNMGCPPSATSKIETLKRDAIISTVGFSAGAAGLVGGLAALLFAPERSESGRIHPFVGPGIAGAAGSFW